MGKKNALFLEEVDELDLAVLAKVALEALLGEGLEVLDVANVHIARGARVHGDGERRRQRPAVLAPANLEAAVVEREALIRRNLVESECRSRIDKGNEL